MAKHSSNEGPARPPRRTSAQKTAPPKSAAKTKRTAKATQSPKSRQDVAKPARVKKRILIPPTPKPKHPADLDFDRDHLIACMELLFFAYRDFTGDPDAVLAHYGFGRAHHRVVHFVNRNPGLSVADLLLILKITKQSLARVLKQLVEMGFIAQKPGKEDKRQRLLFATPKGVRLADKLADLQIRRIGNALKAAGPGADEATRKFLFAMVGTQDRLHVEGLIEARDGEPEAQKPQPRSRATKPMSAKT